MKSLQSFVNKHNSWNDIFGKKPWIIGQDNQKIADDIDNQLEPENLTCDGELSQDQVIARYRELMNAATDLRKLDSTVCFRRPLETVKTFLFK